VLNVVTGHDAVIGPVVVGDPRVKHICFTGSVGGGKRIMEMASANLTNFTLELGGNDPAVVLDDAELDNSALERLASATFMTSGQVCMAIKRLYVPRRRYDETVSGLEAILAPSVVGSGLEDGVTMGPLNTRRQRDYVIELLDEARASGTDVMQLGEFASSVSDHGNHMLPALVLSTRCGSPASCGPASPSSTTTTRQPSTSARPSAASTRAAWVASLGAKDCSRSPRRAFPPEHSPQRDPLLTPCWSAVQAASGFLEVAASCQHPMANRR
jgi:hypothetical protein